MAKTYIVEESVKEWLELHKDDLYDDILIACEEGLRYQENRVTVAMIRTLHGVTAFKLPNIADILFSLQKCEMYYVQTEEYEFAARARDCGIMWADRQRYIKENSK